MSAQHLENGERLDEAEDWIVECRGWVAEIRANMSTLAKHADDHEGRLRALEKRGWQVLLIAILSAVGGAIGGTGIAPMLSRLVGP